MRLSIVIPCYNAAGTIGELLDSLARQYACGPWEVVVADNGCTDGSMAVVDRYRDRLPGLRIVDASTRRGQPHASNVGIGAATGDAIVFLDADDVAGEGWLTAIGRALETHDFVASRFEFEKLNPPWLIATRGRAQSERVETIWYPPHLPYVGGCGMGVKRALIERIGGFAEDLPYLNDVDVSFRLQRAGARPLLVPDAVVHVRFRDDLRSVFRQARRWAEYNTLTYKRHRPAGARLERPWRDYGRAWIWIFRRFRKIRRRIVRYQLAWRIGWQLGLLIGSIRHRVAPAAQPARPAKRRPSAGSRPDREPADRPRIAAAPHVVGDR